MLPATVKEIEILGWNEIDVVLICGDDLTTFVEPVSV